MDWEKLLTLGRYGHGTLSGSEIGRSHFHKDHDRIVFSSAFRKLTGKTQVHPLAINDQIHTRLIHSVEVASVGRSLGLKVGERLASSMPEWVQPDDVGVVVQAACLAHDIGNPPFGHAGEYAIQDWFQQRDNVWLLEDLAPEERLDLQHFEGNAQGLRIVSQLEYHLFNGGLRLTYPTMGSLLKYPWTYDHAGPKGKFSAFQSEKDILANIAKQVGLPELAPNKYGRHPLSFLMEAADDLCYAIIDLEDAVELHILDFDEVEPILRMLCGDRQVQFSNTERATLAPHRVLAALRGRAMQVIIDALVEAFMTNEIKIMQGLFEGDLLSSCPAHVIEGMTAAKQMAHQKVYLDSAKTETEIGAYAVLSTLLDTFIPAGFELYQKKDRSLMSYKTKRVFDLMGGDAPDATASLFHIYQRQLDYLTSMTDNYSGYLARQVGGTGYGQH